MPKVGSGQGWACVRGHRGSACHHAEQCRPRFRRPLPQTSQADPRQTIWWLGRL